jgi:hypothetical protein
MVLSMQRLSQRLASRPLADPASSVSAQITSLGPSLQVSTGSQVAVGCGSRGIRGHAAIVGAVVAGLQKLGWDVFCFPAMGSHGAATAEGQARVLANAGITEEAMGCPIRSSLDVVPIGEMANGMPVVMDRHAHESDAIVVINRVKPHTEFTHRFESGLMKMLAIGMGKEEGATIYHRYFLRDGYAATIHAIAERLTAVRPLLFGVGIAEDGLGQTAEVEVMPGADLGVLIDSEAAMLGRVRAMLPRLPIDDIDVLVIDEMGKDISGSGFDTKIVGRLTMPLLGPDPETPHVKRIVVGDLTDVSGGNADGVGIADFITARLYDKVDRDTLYVNALAGSEPEHARIPMVLPTLREAVEAALATIGPIDSATVRVVHIRNTRDLAELEVSSAVIAECTGRSDLDLVGHPFPVPYTSEGDWTTLRPVP